MDTKAEANRNDRHDRFGRENDGQVLNLSGPLHGKF